MCAVSTFPNPSPLCPAFMFGCFDTDAATPGSDVALGEAILGCKKADQTMSVPLHIHHHAGATAEANGVFMFGVHAEQPALTVAKEEIMYLLPAEQI